MNTCVSKHCIGPERASPPMAQRRRAPAALTCNGPLAAAVWRSGAHHEVPPPMPSLHPHTRPGRKAGLLNKGARGHCSRRPPLCYLVPAPPLALLHLVPGTPLLPVALLPFKLAGTYTRDWFKLFCCHVRALAGLRPTAACLLFKQGLLAAPAARRGGAGVPLGARAHTRHTRTHMNACACVRRRPPATCPGAFTRTVARE
ncbi:MAG: hypothetical protein J3K34DRAFT_429043 [Monoraphidium minutum]|nr:MAG: hypothetical protein J3K34DRAFT_429043 [Monoraphidium minutum]